MSLVLDPLASVVDELSLPWEDLDTYAFPPAAYWAKWWRSCRTAVQENYSQWLYQPWSFKSAGPCVRSEHCTTIWTGPQTSVRIRSWSLSSLRKDFDKDISPATIFSWIKQTVILCYELSDQEALTLHQVKAHNVRAFAASKNFQSGISL